VLQLIQLRLAFGDLPLLDGASLALSRGERVGLVGRNGAGKSSLLRIMARLQSPDDGLVQAEDGLRVVLLEQEPLLPESDTLLGSLLKRAGWPLEPDEVQSWQRYANLRAWIDRFGLKAEREINGTASLSGGECKRAALALAFAQEPDVLLLDEPTNHLDMVGIRQLEEAMERVAASVVITHDRLFLDRVVGRIVELDRGLLRSFPGRFSDYQRLRADLWAAEDKAQRRFERFWAEEEAWIRQGVQARRTRNQGRVRRLESLRVAREARRERVGTVSLRVNAGERTGKLVLECKGVGYTTPAGQVLVKDFDWVLMRGDRVAVMGPNGIGKSTLLKLALGTLEPGCGCIRRGTHWQLAYFDQMREQLDEERTVAQTISPGSEWVETGGRRQHVMSYLGEFLFSPRRANAPVRTLSGGERNRLLLARLFARPANLLVLDEPTNDLDLETLDLLECALQQYTGTVLLVSHDRAFVDAVATQTLVSRGQGVWREYPGGYSDWVAQDGQWPQTESQAPTQAQTQALGQAQAQTQTQSQSQDRSQTQALGQARMLIQTPAQMQTKGPPHAGPVLQPPDRMGSAAPAMKGQGGRGPPTARRKLSFREQRELEQMPARVAALEGEQQDLQRAMLEPGYFRSDAERQRKDRSRVDALEAELLTCLERWEALEAIAEPRAPS